MPARFRVSWTIACTRPRASHNDGRPRVHTVSRRESCYGRSAARTQHVTRQNGHLRNAQSTRRSCTHAARVDTRRMATDPSRGVARKEKSRKMFSRPEPHSYMCWLEKKKCAFRNRLFPRTRVSSSAGHGKIRKRG